MAPAQAQKASWLAFLATFATVQAQFRTSSATSSSTSAFWTYTSRVQDYVSTSTYTYYDGDTTVDLYTTSRAIKTDVTPTVSPVSTSTADSYYSYDEDLQIVYAYYSDGAVAESDLEPTFDYSAELTRTSTDTVYTVFRMPVTYTAPASCPTPFTVSVDETVTVPSEVRDQVTPTSKVTGSLETFLTYAPTQTETWYLSAGAAPLRTSTAYNYEYYVSSCSTPYSYPTSGSGGNYRSGGGDYDDIDVCSWYSGCTSLRTWVIIIACLLPGLFLLGFIESWFWFRRLMLGKSALRFGTICWIMISLWVACFTRTQSKRSPEDQKLLREKWNKTGSGQAFKLWFKWGFRHSYPVPLLGQYSRNTVGIVPEGQPLPQMGQATGPMYGPGFVPQPGAPVAYYPNGQPYYPPPQGWMAPPNGQGYPMPPPGQAYMPPPNGAAGYYEQPKENMSVTERTVSPLPESQAPHPVPNAPSTVPSPPPAHVAEAPSPEHQPAHAYQPPVSDAHPPPGPPPARPT